MRIRHVSGAFSLFLFFCLTATAEIDPLQVWTASGGEARLELRADYLPDFGLEIVHEGRVAHEIIEIRRGFTESDHLIIEAPYGHFEGFAGGEIRLDTGFLIRYQGNEVRLDGLTLTPAIYINGHPSLEARDSAGRHLLTFHHIHVLAEHERGLLTLHNMDFSATKQLAELLGAPQLDDVPLGLAWLDLPLHIPEGANTVGRLDEEIEGGLDCTGRPFWSQDFDDHGHHVDVGLIAMNQIAWQGNLSGTDLAKFAPSATLKNLGQADVPWIPKFSSRPYYLHEPRDQHPYLVFNMYRILDGRIEQLGASGVKHAFLTINVACDTSCPYITGNLLPPVCEDVYSTGNNDDNFRMGAREDIETAEGLFYSTCSFFDPDCTGSQTTNSGLFENRMLIDTNHLNIPGAEYFMDAWYVIMHDINIWNSMGHRQINPQPQGSGWTVPGSAFHVGPTLEKWVNPNNLQAGEDYAEIVVPSATPGETYPNNMPQGHINVAVKVTEPQPGRYRYNYAVQNYDFDRGIEAFRVPISQGATVFETFFGAVDTGVDGEPIAEWTVTISDGYVNFEAPTEADRQSWFTLFNFEIETNAPPTASEVTLDLGGDAVVPSMDAEILGPERGPAPIPGDVTLEPAFPGVPNFNFPVALRHAGDGSGRIFIVERDGFIRIIDDQGDLLPDPFLNITAQVDTFFEGGLLGLAFHPDFPNNGKFYVNFTSSGLTTRIAEFEVDSGNPDLADPSSQLNILSIPQPAGNHNGGDIHFGPDGYLYIGMGDGGPSGHGQNLNTLLGAMLRIDIDGDDFPGDPNRNYAIPADNPFVGVTGEDEIWSYGLRNPYRWSFDRDTGDMWVADVGQSTWEEVNLEPAGGSGGDNYGWNVCEASWQTGSTTIPCPLAGSTLPVLEYRNSGTNNCSVTGGYRYRGPFPSLQGWYIYGDYCSGRVWLAQEAGGDWIADEFDNVGFGIVGFGEDEAGHLYLLRSNGEILRFEGDEGAVPELGLTPAALNFGSVQVGQQASLDVELESTGTATLEVSALVLPGAPFSVDTDDCGGSAFDLEPEESCTLTVTFAPGADGGFADELVIDSNAGSSPDTVDLSGTGLGDDPEPALSLNPDSLDFGSVDVGEQASLDIELESTGTATLEVSALVLPGAPFSVDTDDCGGSAFDLEPEESCTLTVTFAPGAGGGFADELAIESNAGTSPDVVALSGTGVEEQAPGELAVDPASVDFGNVAVDDSGTDVVTVSNVAPEGAAALSLDVAIIAGGDAFEIAGGTCGATLEAQASCEVELHFTPAAEIAYAGVLRIVTDVATVNVDLAGNGAAAEPGIFEDRFEELALLLRGTLTVLLPGAER